MDKINKNCLINKKRRRDSNDNETEYLIKDHKKEEHINYDYSSPLNRDDINFDLRTSPIFGKSEISKIANSLYSGTSFNPHKLNLKKPKSEYFIKEYQSVLNTIKQSNPNAYFKTQINKFEENIKQIKLYSNEDSRRNEIVQSFNYTNNSLFDSIKNTFSISNLSRILEMITLIGISGVMYNYSNI